MVAGQMEMVELKPSDMPADLWLLGYCFGFFDIISQMYGIDDQADALLFIAGTFDLLPGGSDQLREGSRLVGVALARQHHGDPTFKAGRDVGTEDGNRYYKAPEGDPPTELVTQYMLGRNRRSGIFGLFKRAIG
jgi:hypothetical protein